MTSGFNIAPPDLLSRALQEWDSARHLPPEQRVEALKLADASRILAAPTLAQTPRRSGEK